MEDRSSNPVEEVRDSAPAEDSVNTLIPDAEAARMFWSPVSFNTARAFPTTLPST